MKITLRVNGELRALPINPRNPVLDIGRTPDNLLVLEGGSVSRRHLTIRYSSGVWSAIDTSSNGTWHNQAFFHHQRVILAEGDALVIGGHEVEVVSLPPLTDAGETSRVSAILLISANRGSGRVLLELSGKTLQVRISPQQEALFLLLLKEWRGKADGGFGYIERDEEFALLGRLSPGTEPNNRLHVSRSRLRTWWRRLHKKTPELSQAPIDLLDTERPDHIRLSLRALQVRLDDQPLHGGT